MTGRPAGVLLLLYTARNDGGETRIHCNLSSWYVEPAFRNYAPLLTRIAQRNKEVTIPISARHGGPGRSSKTQGFSSYCNGLLFSIPLLSACRPRIAVETVSPETSGIAGLSETEAELLIRHARYRCLSLVCRTAGVGVFPFILSPLRLRRGWIAPPAMHLIYCRDIADYVRCAGAIGRTLVRRGKLSVILDSNGPVAGLAGIYSGARGRKYFKGPHRPRLADLTDTELVLYGP